MKPSKTTPTDPSLDIYVPAGLRESRRYNDRVIVAGRGPIPSDLMFISASVLEEESADAVQGVFGASFNRKPAYLKGGVGIALKDLCTSVGISVDAEVYYTALCKWQLPKNEVLNPKRGKCEPGIACLIRELEEVKPKVVVAFGKAVFEFLCPGVIKFGDGLGMWFWSAEYQCRVMPMSHQQFILTKPEWFETYRLNLQQVKQMWDETRGIEVNRVPLNYSVCRTADDLRVLVEILKDFYLYSIDCEWHGFSHVDGYLRSLQICWAPGCASYIRFMDDQLNYVFDVSYEEAGAILAPVWNRKAVELVGHHISADLPWTFAKLGLEWYRKTRLDTEFAYQCCDEHGQRGLEWMSIRYTDLGRYEMELEVWKKKNKDLCEGGYGRIPDDILIPYGCKDVDVPMRAYLQIEADLRRQGMLHYYRDIMNPFCTDVFTQFALTGLPMNVPAMHEMREVYSFARSEMEAEFRQAYYEEAWDLLATHCMLVACPWPSDMPVKTRRGLTEIARAPQSIKLRLAFEDAPDMLSGTTAVMNVIQAAYGEVAVTHATVQAAVAHATSAKIQKIDSTNNKKRWLFDLKGYTPIKSTNNKAKGVPTMSWEKVMAMKPEQREGISPAVDKQTIQILADTHSDNLLKSLLTLQAVATVIKSFLSEPERDEDGTIIEEAGLLIWVSSDQRIHGQLSMTETGRPRAWKPNILNWMSYVQDKIKDGIKATILRANAEGRLPAALNCYAEGKKILPLRSTMQVPEEDILIESDYVTAEVLGLAYISGDTNLIRIMTEPDAQFGVLNDKDGTPVRIGFAEDCGISLEKQDARCLMAVWSEGKMKKQVSAVELQRKPDGSLLNPRVDLHWSLAEAFQNRPREFLTKKADRGAGKVGNFCIAEDEEVLTKRGPVAIQNVIDCDMLWDGLEWVHHGGVIYTGTREVREYQGLSATDNHEVWTHERGKVSFHTARTQRLTLVRSGRASGAHRYSRVDRARRDSAEIGRRVFLCANDVPILWSTEGEGVAQPGDWEVEQMPVSWGSKIRRQISRRGSRRSGYAEEPLSCDAATVQHRHARVESQVPWERDTGSVRLRTGLYRVGSEDVAGGVLQREGLRQNRQRRSLREVQFAIGRSIHEPAESSVHAGFEYICGQKVSDSLPFREVHGANGSRSAALRVGREGNSGAQQSEPPGRMAKVYDIVNAGPRHRFTCSGVLVSNSTAYGATTTTLERKIESDTGSKPEAGLGQKIMDALEVRQRVAQEWLVSLESAPENPGYLRAASGKVRHFVLPHEAAGHNSRLRRSIMSAQGREARNFFMQESVASTAGRAAVWLMDFGRHFKLKGITNICLYDSLATWAPRHERFIWAKAHKLFMQLANGWAYHGRVLRYSIDTEFNLGWSLRPSEAELIYLDDPTHKPTPEHLKAAEQWLDTYIAYYAENEKASLTFPGWRS